MQTPHSSQLRRTQGGKGRFCAGRPDNIPGRVEMGRGEFGRKGDLARGNKALLRVNKNEMLQG